jgi:hypothetical protein
MTTAKQQERWDHEDDKLGAGIARVLMLKRDRETGKRWKCDVWRTAHGTKTNRGLARTVRGILDGSVQP